MRPRLPGDAGPVEFFTAFVGREEELQREVFFLAYHLHWSPDMTLGLETPERWAYVRLLVDQLENERSAIDDARSA